VGRAFSGPPFSCAFDRWDSASTLYLEGQRVASGDVE